MSRNNIMAGWVKTLDYCLLTLDYCWVKTLDYCSICHLLLPCRPSVRTQVQSTVQYTIICCRANPAFGRRFRVLCNIPSFVAVRTQRSDAGLKYVQYTIVCCRADPAFGRRFRVLCNIPSFVAVRTQRSAAGLCEPNTLRAACPDQRRCLYSGNLSSSMCEYLINIPLFQSGSWILHVLDRNNSCECIPVD